MNKKALILIISAVLSAMAWSASAYPEEEKAIAASEVPRSPGGSAQAPSSGEGGAPALERRNPRYQLGVDDVLDLDFPFTPEFDQTVSVQPDGFITLHGVGEVHVGGQTVPEVTQALRTAYAKILHDPVITITVTDFVKPYFTVNGAVARAGRFDLRGDTTVSEAIAIAGGFNENSKHSQVLLFRRVSNDFVEVKKLNVKQMHRVANLSEDPHLRPGDLVFVPQNLVSKIKRIMPVSVVGVYYNPL
jgi:polysaccharide export outer membrane protein